MTEPLWQPYHWPDIRDGTIADIRMESGREYRARLGYRGRVGAWWPLVGQRRKRPIGTCEPVAIRIIAHGVVPVDDHSRSFLTQTGQEPT